MKKILMFGALACLIIFAGCDDGSGVDGDTQKAVDIAVQMASGMSKMAAGSSISSGDGPEIAAGDNYVFSGTNVYTETTVDGGGNVTGGKFSISFSEYSAVEEAGVTLEGTIVYLFGIEADGAMNGTLTGDLTLTMEGESYEITFDLTQKMSDTSLTATATVSGTVSCNGQSVDVNESL